MELGLFLRISWLCLLFGSGACFPAKGGYRYPYTAPTTFNLGEVPLPYSNTPSFGDGPVAYSNTPSLSFGDGPVSYSNTPSFGDGPVPSSGGFLPWAAQPAGGASAYYEPSNWMPSAPSDLNVWGFDEEMPQSVSEPFPLPPSSYIIQSKNGYQQEREFLSYTQYSPETFDSAGSPSKAVRAPSRPAPMPVAKGGQKV